MQDTWKKILALCLSAIMLAGCFTACGNNQAQTETTQPLVTEPSEEAKTLKVLTLGHSLAVDAGHMLALIADAEGYEDMTVATLYYSGCSLASHVEFLTNGSRVYELFVSSTTTADEPPKSIENVTMGEAIKYDYWDIIIMQGGVFEIAENVTYITGSIQTIQNYVNQHKKNPNTVFGWNMAWAPPVDDELRSMYPFEPNYYVNGYAAYRDDRTVLYNSIAQCVKNNIVPDESFVCMIPSGTVMENALSSYLEEKDLHRDYAHATDLARVMVSYVWYCTLTGIDHLDEIKLDTVPRRFFRTTRSPVDWKFTEGEKALILETVNNALANPLQMTQSQYTQAPTK